jgi:3-oxoacyl-[acyl-carrier protein] reductase
VLPIGKVWAQVSNREPSFISDQDNQMTQSLEGKVAVVTGASKGIGAAIALRLAADGAAVVVNYIRALDDAQRVVQRVIAAGGRAVAVRADLAQPDDIAPLMDAAVSHFGRLDILVNNAAIYKVGTLEAITPQSFDDHFHLNVRGPMLASQAAARVMADGGAIVNISSGVAKSPFPIVHVYASTKGAIDTFTRSLALELGPRHIRVVGIAPGYVVTEGNAEAPKEMVDALVARTPLGRSGQPSDIANAVAWAVSADAGWVTGSTIDAAGGLVL